MSVPYVQIFLAYNPPPPWPCSFCEEPVGLEDLTVHHLDHDHSNDVIENLAAAHFSCHSSHHSRTQVRRTGFTQSPETRKKISERQLAARRICNECGKESHGAGIAAHQRSSGHTGITKR